MKIKTFRRSSAFFLATALCLGSVSGVSAMNESELSKIIEEAKNTDVSGCTPESCASLKAALEGAEVLLEKDGVTEEELGAGGMMLQAILENGMVAQADKSSLEAALTEVAAYTDGTQEGYEELENARTQAQAVFEDGNATQAETDGATSAVVQAEENLGGGVDKSVLADLISQAEGVDTSTSDEASVNFLKTAIASAKQVNTNSAATQSLVDKHIQLLQAAAEALYGKTDPDTVYDGVYEIGGMLRHATADQVSMGNAALVKPFQLVKKGDDIHLRIECTALTTKLGKVDFSGYLARMWWYPLGTEFSGLALGDGDMGTAVVSEEEQTETLNETTEEAENISQENEDGNTDEEETDGDLFVDEAAPQSDDTASQQSLEENAVPSAEAATANEAGIESYYDTYDSYNDPQKGTDAKVKGQKYPHYITIPVELNQSLVWTKIYVPVMEAINTGGGEQYAKLCLDWNDLKQISGTDADKSALKSGITNAKKVQKSLQQDAQGYAKEQMDMVSAAITAAQAVYTNMNTDQTIVDNEVKALTMAVNTVTEVKVTSDKSELKKAIETADTYLNEKDVDYETSTLEALRNARNRAQEVYDNGEATQTEINKCVTAVDNAIQSLIIQGTDRRALKKTLTTAKTYLADTSHYTAADMDVLRSVYETAKAVYEDKKASQEETDAQTGILDYVLKNMKKTSENKADRNGLYEMLLTASNMAGREEIYTESTIKALNSAITEAKTVYDNESATQKQVNAQISKLSKAIKNLKKKSSGSTENNNSGNNGGNNSRNDGGNNSGNNNGNNNNGTDNKTTLDVKNLEDGVYSVSGSMVKIDKESSSMSNEAINHTIKLTVKKGKYSLTLDFKGMTINEQLGYLGTLKYFKSGYKTDQYGTPSGSLGDVTVDSYQEYSDGKKVSDNFGTDYPDVVTFPLIDEAKSDGYVPLQVFVPIMDAISKGTGTQPAYLKLDWSTLKKTDSKDSGIKDDSSNGNEKNESNSGNNSAGENNGTLKPGGNGSLNGNSSKLSANGSLSGSSSKTGSSSLKSNGSLKSAGTGTAKTTSQKKSAGTTALKSGKSLKSGSGNKNTGTTQFTSKSQTDAYSQNAGETGTGTAYADENTKESGENTAKKAISISLSALAALAGVFYKVKSRGGSLKKQVGKKR